MALAMTSTYYTVNSLSRIMIKDNIPLAAGKSKMFSIGCLKFLDSYNFLSVPLDQMARYIREPVSQMGVKLKHYKSKYRKLQILSI